MRVTETHITSVKLLLPPLLPWSPVQSIWALPEGIITVEWHDFSWSSHLSNPPVSIQDCTRGLSFPSKASKSSPGAHRAAKAPGSWPGNFCALLQVGGSQPEPRLPSHCSDPHSVSEFFPLRFLRPVTEPRPSSLFQDLTLSFLPDQSCSEHPRETGC